MVRITPLCGDFLCQPAPTVRFATPAVPPAGVLPPDLASRQSKQLQLKWNQPKIPGSSQPLMYRLFWDGGSEERAVGDFVELYQGDERRARVS